MRRKTIFVIMIALMILMSGFYYIAHGDNSVGFYPPQPKDVSVLVSKPTISMQFILNGNKIKTMDMQINNKKVEVRFDDENQTVYYIPQESLTPGTYKVDLSVNIEGWTKPITQSWQFTVSDKAMEELPPPNNEQKQALNYANIYRKYLGLKELKFNSSLNAAAMAHSNYMAANKTTTHDEFSSRPGFTGITPYNRAAAFGYTGGYVAENVSSGQRDYKEAIDELFLAPYHRLMWVNPFLKDFGYGSKDKYYTFDLGGKKGGEDQMIIYPLDKQTDVPISWDGNETPNPLRLHSKQGTVGYPITLSYFTDKNIEKFTIEKANLTDSKGSTIRTFLNQPVQDKNLTESIIIIPADPLATGEKYTVTVKGRIHFQDQTSTALDRTWSFTTATSEVVQNGWKTSYLYEDIGSHWAKDIVVELLKNQIITAKTEDAFKPNDRITRGEFAEFIVNAMGFQTRPYEGSFKDVPSSNLKAVFIESAYREGIIKGLGNEIFAPNRLINREEMAVMVAKAYEKRKGTNALQSMPVLTFADHNQISDWALEAVKSASHLGIVKGRGNNRFEPKASATRAEASVMIKKMLDTF